jgi:hypothetical protein
VAIALEGARGGAAARIAAAAWRFRPGVAGARLALEVTRSMPHHAVLALGFEEQHGARRDPPPRSAGLRQGLRASWRSGPGPLRLLLGQEVWGHRAIARGAVRVVSSAAVEAEGPAGTVVRVSHVAFRSRSGESLYLPEVESDRLVLRALSGEGRRTRVEIDAPVAAGRLRAAIGIADANGRRPRPQWTLDWSRRARTRATRSSS